MERQRWREATLDDILYVLTNLRPADHKEIQAMFGKVPLFGLSGYVIVNAQGERVALAGVAPVRSWPWMAEIWCVATPAIENHKIEFLRYTKPFIEQQPYDLLFNWVHADNELHIKWLQWCGFSFVAKRENFGVAGETFYEFCRIN